MKTAFMKHRTLWICAIAVVLVAAIGISLFAVFGSNKNKVSTEISIDEAQKIVDTTFDDLAKSTALGSSYVLDNTEIVVTDLEYGNEKDVILTCSYNTLDVKNSVANEIDTIMQDVYGYYLENEAAGKKTNATKVNLRCQAKIRELLDGAQVLNGTITLYIYETAEGFQLYLNKDVVNTVTGGLLDATTKIKETNTVEYNGETIDISKQNTLRTGINDCIALENYSTTKPSTGNGLQKAWLDFKDEFSRNFVEGRRWMYLIEGLGTTLAITACSALLGIFLGILVALIRCTRQMTNKLKLPDAICQLYLTVTRGTPVMVQLLILFFVVMLPLGVEKFPAAVICFGLNSGAYVAEIVRGGIMSVDKGQIEAGRSLGFNYVQTMVHFVVPQAFKAILPSLANEFITLLKESSVAFYIGIADLTQGGLKIRSITYSNFMPLIAVALIYLVLVVVMTKLVGILERRLARSDR